MQKSFSSSSGPNESFLAIIARNLCRKVARGRRSILLSSPVSGCDRRFPDPVHMRHEADKRAAGIAVDANRFHLERMDRENVSVRVPGRRRGATITRRAEIGSRLK